MQPVLASSCAGLPHISMPLLDGAAGKHCCITPKEAAMTLALPLICGRAACKLGPCNRQHIGLHDQ